MNVRSRFQTVRRVEVFTVSAAAKQLVKKFGHLVGLIALAAVLPSSFAWASPPGPLQSLNPTGLTSDTTQATDPQELKATLMSYCAAGKALDEAVGKQVESVLGAGARKRFEKFLAAKSAKAGVVAQQSPPSMCEAEASPTWAFSKDYAFVSELVAASQEEADANSQPELKALKLRGRDFHFLGVVHISMIRSETLIEKTLDAINNQLQSFQPDLIIVEGLEAALGVSSCKAAVHVLWFSDDQADISLGEAKLVVRYAAQNGIDFQGGEPSVAELQELVTNPQKLAKMKYRYSKFTASDLADFDSFIRFAAQARQASAAERQEMAHSEQASSLAGFYQKFEKKKLSDEDLGTLYDRYTETTTATEEPSLRSLFSFHLEARDARLRKTICHGLGSHKKVLVIFGKYHLKTNWPCVEAWSSK